ncbi:MAG: hypothetical protein R2882_02605 [Gemmatimonadales bacterium]
MIRGRWRFDARAGKVILSLEQTQSGSLSGCRWRSAFATGPTARPIERIELRGSSGSFEFAAERPPAAVALDPNFTVLMTAVLTPEGAR